MELNIFKTNRLKLAELYNDAFEYIKDVYDTNGKEFTMASPFAQIVVVMLNLGRLILFYIENSITEMNIETAYQARSIRGLYTLTGHSPSRGIAARGSLYMSYNMSGEHAGETIYIKNYSKITNTTNGLSYIAVFSTNVMQITVGAFDSKVEIPIIQGEIKYQQGTGTGESLQSFNFASKTDNIVDDFFVNVYVNGKRWDTVSSILDMTYNQEACIVKTALNGGIDVFFGTGNNGKIPVVGSTILLEYIVTSGLSGNVSAASENDYWEFSTDGYDQNGDYVDLNTIYTLSSASDIIFGTGGESLSMTRMLAPKMSRSFVLANATNYKTFLSKLNIFSIIDAFSGFNTEEDSKIETAYNDAKNNYNSVKESYLAQVNLTGKSSDAALKLEEDMLEAKAEVDALKIKYDDAKLDDNIVYLYLVPDISKRLGDSESYFTCSQSRFLLTDDEKLGVLNLIEDSGMKVITVDNKIIDPIYVKFSINIFVQIYNAYNFNSIKSNIISLVSNYLIKNERRDRIPISDIINIVRSISGVDSVTAFFDADKNNAVYYGGSNYGIDEYGDIILTRNVVDKLGNTININDLQPLFRGPFTSSDGVYYEDSLDALVGPINITLRGKSNA